MLTMRNRQLKKPTIRSQEKSLYYQAPPGLEQQTRPNLSKKLSELVKSEEEVVVTDPAIPTQFKYKLVFKSSAAKV